MTRDLGCIEAGLFCRVTISSARPLRRSGIFLFMVHAKKLRRTMARASALLAVRAAITMPSLACDPRRGIEEPSAKVPKSWGAPGHGLHLPPNELEETPQAIATTLRRVRGLGKAVGLSKWRIRGDCCRAGTHRDVRLLILRPNLPEQFGQPGAALDDLLALHVLELRPVEESVFDGGRPFAVIVPVAERQPLEGIVR